MQQRVRGKRRTGYLYLDSAPKMPKAPLDPSPVVHVKEPGTIKAQLLGKLGQAGYQKLIGALKATAS